MSKSERYFTLDAQKKRYRVSKYLELFQSINAHGRIQRAPAEEEVWYRNPARTTSLTFTIPLRSMGITEFQIKAACIRELLLDAKYLYERALPSMRSASKMPGSSQKRWSDQLALLEVNKEMRNVIWDLKRQSFREEVQGLITEKESFLEAVRRSSDTWISSTNCC